MEVDMEQKTEIQILETLEQKRETIPLYQQAFADPELFVSYYYKEKCKDNWIFVKKKANKIIAMLHLNPYTIFVNGNEYPSFYIVAVATEKQHRHQGHMKDLLYKAFAWMKERKVPFCFLMPVDPKIYEPFGFEKICDFDHNAQRSMEEIQKNFNIDFETRRNLSKSFQTRKRVGCHTWRRRRWTSRSANHYGENNKSGYLCNPKWIETNRKRNRFARMAEKAAYLYL